jgi:hypothetical protein
MFVAGSRPVAVGAVKLLVTLPLLFYVAVIFWSISYVDDKPRSVAAARPGRSAARRETVAATTFFRTVGGRRAFLSGPIDAGFARPRAYCHSAQRRPAIPVMGMVERLWKAFYWTFAALIFGLAMLDAYIWIGPDIGGRLLGSAICGFVASSIWLLVASGLYHLASR